MTWIEPGNLAAGNDGIDLEPAISALDSGVIESVTDDGKEAIADRSFGTHRRRVVPALLERADGERLYERRTGRIRDSCADEVLASATSFEAGLVVVDDGTREFRAVWPEDLQRRNALE